jgi:hypothetical protein
MEKVFKFTAEWDHVMVFVENRLGEAEERVCALKMLKRVLQRVYFEVGELSTSDKVGNQIIGFHITNEYNPSDRFYSILLFIFDGSFDRLRYNTVNTGFILIKAT